MTEIPVSLTFDQGGKRNILGVAVFFIKKAQIDIGSPNLGRLDLISTYGYLTPQIDLFSLTPQHKKLKMSGNVYLGDI